jgi:hypothetical protein
MEDLTMTNLIKVLLIALAFTLGCIGLSTNRKIDKVVDQAVTHPVELQKDWDKIYPTIITKDIYNVWKKVRADKTYPQPRWAKISIKEATQLIVYLCDAYNIKYPDQVVKDEKYLKSQDKKFNFDGVENFIGSQIRVSVYDGKVTIYFRYDQVFLMNVFHEFYHLLDYRKNGNFELSDDTITKDFDFSQFPGNKFWDKYVARLFEYEKKMKHSNRF